VTRAIIWQFGKYAFVGLLSATVDFGVFILLTRFFGFSTIPANLISVFVALSHSFVWHRLFTFKAAGGKRIGRQVTKFVAVSGVQYVLQQVLLPVLLLLPGERVVGSYEDLVAKAFIVGALAVGGFLANRHWTFKNLQPLSLGQSPR
jgi:putative flippase GtrA